MTVKPSGEIENGTKETIEDIRAEWRATDRENARISRWKSKARGLTRDMTACTDNKDWRGHTTNRCRCWKCGTRPFDRSKLETITGESCEHCGCRKIHTPPACPKLTPAKIETEENATVRRAMILCYGLARMLQDAGLVVEQSPEYTFLRHEIDRWNAIAGMKDAEGNIIVVGGECRTLADALAWFTKKTADALVNRGQGSTEDIVRAELLRSL